MGDHGYYEENWDMTEVPDRFCMHWHDEYGACERLLGHAGRHSRVPSGGTEANEWDDILTALDPEPLAGPGILTMPDIKVRRGLITAAGGWCAPPGGLYDINAPLTDEEKIKSLERRIADHKAEIRLMKANAKAARKRIRKLERALIQQLAP